MEGARVKLLGLSIRGLYDYYDYTIDFNTDVTFIYGMNGCGKTTILNITEAIITGQLFKLFNYRFKEISLKYAGNSNLDDVKEINIHLVKHEIVIGFDSNRYRLQTLGIENTLHQRRNNATHIASEYFHRYGFLKVIRDTFNYVYLPLNRSFSSSDDFESMFIYDGRFRNGNLMDDDPFLEVDNRDGAMIKIESLVYRQYSKANAAINRISDSFRNSMLKPQIEINKNYNMEKILNEMGRSNALNLKKTQEVYIKILKEFGLVSESEEKDYNNFFESFINDLSRFVDEDVDPDFTLELVLKFQEISRIQQTIDLANEMEKQKTGIIKPIKTFLGTMNSFIESSEDGKEICIDNDGRIYFKTQYSNERISIQRLSSGEKQLITFFANLIFKVKDGTSGIFVVDEPELSLHLSWQKIFIDKVLEINKDIQLVFATHAPEIIGRRRDKMYKLEKHYTKVESK